MSLYTTVEVGINDLVAYLDAVKSILGEHVEAHLDAPVALRGYLGDDRSKLPVLDANYAPLCHIVLRRERVGRGANDVGIEICEGKAIFWVSQYDRQHGFGQAKIDAITAKARVNYSQTLVEREAHRAGFRVSKRWTTQTGEQKIQLVRGCRG